MTVEVENDYYVTEEVLDNTTIPYCDDSDTEKCPGGMYQERV